MKIGVISVVFCFLFISCTKKETKENVVSELSQKLEIERFDSVFFETKPENLASIKAQYPYFFSKNTPDSVWVNKMKNPLWRELYAEVKNKYQNIEPVKNDLEAVFKNINNYFPKAKLPKVITIISEMDYTNKAIFTDSLLVISLELYLGKNHKFYQFPEYIKQNLEPRQIMPDVVQSFSLQVIPPTIEKNLLSLMVQSGKKLLLKDKLIPDFSDAEKIGYTPEQLVWCQENETYIWRYFIEKELLYSTDSKLASRFINPAPFSKFYLEIDNESPGRVGEWIGWQIVRSYMENNEVSLQQLVTTPESEIFNKSKYKPKK